MHQYLSRALWRPRSQVEKWQGIVHVDEQDTQRVKSKCQRSSTDVNSVLYEFHEKTSMRTLREKSISRNERRPQVVEEIELLNQTLYTVCGVGTF
jgi:hypothetical protein